MVEKQEIPTIQELTERTKKEEIEELEEKAEEIEEEIEEEKKELKEEGVGRIKEEVRELREKVSEVEKKGFFGRLKEKIITKKINEDQFENLFWDLEVSLLENNVAVEVIEKIKEDLKKNLVEKPIKRNKIEEVINASLKESIEDVLNVETFDLLAKIKEKKPYIICFVGVNGSGKTTTIAKIVKLLKDNRLSVVLAASDTFRAASIEQLQKHADNLGVKLIKHNYGSDPAAVAYDAIQHAKAQNIDVVLIDTAGRMHSNINLTDEMKKIARVTKPDLKIFVGESITGNDCIEQAKQFNEAIGIDGIILAKADVDEKGGAAVSVSYVTGKPIIYLGTGQGYSNLEKFDSSMIIKSLGLEA
ncbi:signal recognition particle-docking protein FtsY [Candidatus Woesearchaeota archaeon]|nr:signal recognition particle-docking protein FtsY [Candidatus Woesearchaeota archaeon]